MTALNMFGQVLHNNDAEFRVWSKAISDMLQGIGMVKTADTGQIDFTTVLRPAANVYAGYEIYRFDDTLQATRPIFFKLEYGTSSTTTVPNLRITVGSGSNGAGTITGIQTNNLIHGRNVAPAGGNNSNSWGCKLNAVGGFFVSMFSQGASATPFGFFNFGIQRLCDDTGAPTDEGYALYAQVNSTTAYHVWSYLSNAAICVSSQQYALVPSGLVTATSFGTDVQAYRHVASSPRLRQLPMMLTVLVSEFARGSTFTTTAPGGTTRTYMAVADSVTGVSSTNASQHCLAFMYE